MICESIDDEITCMMREYIPIDVKVLKKSTKVVAIALGVLCLIFGVYFRSVYAFVVGVFILAAMVLNKKTAVTENGVEVTYDMILFKRVDLWSFAEIKEIHRELSPDGKKYALHVMKDIMSKRLVFSIPDAEKVIALALEKNPKIHVADVD